MSEGILGNATGGFGFPRSFVIVDENGTELTGVVTDNVKVFDATPADVRKNKIFASENGIQIGENTITYRTTQGVQSVLPGNTLSIKLPDYDMYNYTKLQCIIAPFNDSIDNSCAVDKTVINNGLYNVGSIDKVADVTKNSDNSSIELNVTNSSSNVYIIRYFTYREEF